jgi:predicted regulator of Ras-like GTPase activity (Roadblock/LC7/MglB family)
LEAFVFQPTLERLVGDVQGAIGAAVLSLDGLVVQAVNADGQVVASDDAIAQYGPVLRQLTNIAQSVDLGEVTQFTLESADRATLVRVLSPEYVAILTVSPQTVPGKGHFYLRVASPDLVRQL